MNVFNVTTWRISRQELTRSLIYSKIFNQKKNLFYKSVNKNNSCKNTLYSSKGSVIAAKEVNEWRLVSKGWQNSIIRIRHNLRLQVEVAV